MERRPGRIREAPGGEGPYSIKKSGARMFLTSHCSSAILERARAQNRFFFLVNFKSTYLRVTITAPGPVRVTTHCPNRKTIKKARRNAAVVIVSS